jgi:hypothetical protein
MARRPQVAAHERVVSSQWRATHRGLGRVLCLPSPSDRSNEKGGDFYGNALGAGLLQFKQKTGRDCRRVRQLEFLTAADGAAACHRRLRACTLSASAALTMRSTHAPCAPRFPLSAGRTRPQISLSSGHAGPAGYLTLQVIHGMPGGWAPARVAQAAIRSRPGPADLE